MTSLLKELDNRELATGFGKDGLEYRRKKLKRG